MVPPAVNNATRLEFEPFACGHRVILLGYNRIKVFAFKVNSRLACEVA